MMNDLGKESNFFWNPFSILLSIVIFFLIVWWMSGCTSNHYFSINAEEMTNPSILYKDSTTLTNPF